MGELALIQDNNPYINLKIKPESIKFDGTFDEEKNILDYDCSYDFS